ncbi:GNAT family N-acetyltransferase [Actinospongicola halichondriae]|uniref:GNAT family N-acetyltransferase n=1 Tax=Actinospongicola halichondriae TaxID=3236844 RepID=UPI003D435038
MTTSARVVRPAQPGDVAAMRQIGADAGRRFATVDDPRIAACADDEPFEEHELAAWIARDRAWVAVVDTVPVGFVVVDVVDGNAHIEEIAVDPRHGRSGHGQGLLDAVAAWAADHAYPAVTLTTFADVPWNRPWYERQGFHVLDPAEPGPELAARVRVEEAEGLPADLRVCMGRTV